MSVIGLLVDVRNLLGHFHPAVVHFPLALLLVGAAVEAWGGIQGCSERSPIGRFLLLLGTLGAVGAVMTGLSLFHPEDFRGKTLEVARAHRLLGLGTLGAAIVSVGTGGLGPAGPTGGRLRAYRILFVVTGLLAGLTGHYGGWVVFGWGRVWTF